jgi:hypothetical protein
VTRAPSQKQRILTTRHAKALGLLGQGWQTSAALAKAVDAGSGNGLVRELRAAGWPIVGRWVNRTGDGPGMHHKIFHIEGQRTLFHD